MQEAPAAPGLRAAKKLATRRALSVAARELVAAQGFDGVTVEMICAQVGVSVRTFFNYFESKESAIVGPPRPIAADAALSTFVAGGPYGDLLRDLLILLDPSAAIETEGRDQIALAFELAAREPRVLPMLLTRAMEQEKTLAGLIADRRGLAAADATCTTIAALALVMIRHGSVEWLRSDDPGPIDSYFQQAAATLRALLTSADPR